MTVGTYVSTYYVIGFELSILQASVRKVLGTDLTLKNEGGKEK